MGEKETVKKRRENGIMVKQGNCVHYFNEN